MTMYALKQEFDEFEHGKLAMIRDDAEGQSCTSNMAGKSYHVESVELAAGARRKSFADKKYLLKKIRRTPLKPMTNEPQAFSS